MSNLTIPRWAPSDALLQQLLTELHTIERDLTNENIPAPSLQTAIAQLQNELARRNGTFQLR